MQLPRLIYQGKVITQASHWLWFRGDVAVWRFGTKVVGMLKLELLWDIAPPAAR